MIGAPGLVTVTVTAGSRRADLAVPSLVPVAELLPDLTRWVGLLDASTAYGGYQLVLRGAALAADSSLACQGVEDGAVITVTSGADDQPPRVYDDLVEAVADVVEDDLTHWDPASGRRATRVAAAVMLGLAAAAGVMSGPIGRALGLPLVAAGAGALLSGVVALVVLRGQRGLFIPPVVVGGFLLTTGVGLEVTGIDAAVVLATSLVLIVVLGSLAPWLAVGVTGLAVEEVASVADLIADPEEVDPARVRADARLAHDVLVATSATFGLLLVVTAPWAVSLGVWGTLVAVLGCLVAALRTRQYRVGSEVLVGLASSVAGIISTAVSVLLLHPGWRPAAAISLAFAGVVLLAATRRPAVPSLRRGRLGDLVETAALVVLPPLLVLATGAFSALRR